MNELVFDPKESYGSTPVHFTDVITDEEDDPVREAMIKVLAENAAEFVPPELMGNVMYIFINPRPRRDTDFFPIGIGAWKYSPEVPKKKWKVN